MLAQIHSQRYTWVVKINVPHFPSTAGADIKEISELNSEDVRQIRYLEDLCDGVRNVRKPVIVAVEGKAVCLIKPQTITCPNLRCYE